MLFKNLINSIINEDNDICLLCFQNIENINHIVHINDHVIIENHETTTLYELLNTVLGANLLKDSYLTNVCQECARLAINSFVFKKMCQRNYEYLDNTVSYLRKTMETIFSNTSSYKSLFVIKDKYNERYNTYFDCNSLNSVTDALKLVQSLNEQNTENPEYRETTVHMPKPSINVDKITMESDSDNEVIVEIEKLPTNLEHADIKMENHNDVNTYFTCKKCVKTFSTSSSLRQHHKRIHAPKLFKCTKCPRQYGSASILETHLYESHTDSICSTCGKTFSKQSMKLHELSHKTKLICPTCGRVYKHKNSYNQHIALKICEQTSRKRLSQAVFTCDVCNKKFCQKSSLRTHITFEHGNRKAYTCDWCTKRYSALSKLKAHIVTHTQEKKFVCEQCGGHFVTKESLLCHTRIHTGEKPYQCDHCKERFLSSSRRAEHIRRHHTEPTLECDVCKKKFKIKFALQEHRMRHFNPTSKLYRRDLAENHAEA